MRTALVHDCHDNTCCTHGEFIGLNLEIPTSFSTSETQQTAENNKMRIAETTLV
jgi:hypothetical protein